VKKKNLETGLLSATNAKGGGENEGGEGHRKKEKIHEDKDKGIHHPPSPQGPERKTPINKRAPKEREGFMRKKRSPFWKKKAPNSGGEEVRGGWAPGLQKANNVGGKPKKTSRKKKGPGEKKESPAWGGGNSRKKKDRRGTENSRERKDAGTSLKERKNEQKNRDRKRGVIKEINWALNSSKNIQRKKGISLFWKKLLKYGGIF